MQIDAQLPLELPGESLDNIDLFLRGSFVVHDRALALPHGMYGAVYNAISPSGDNGPFVFTLQVLPSNKKAGLTGITLLL